MKLQAAFVSELVAAPDQTVYQVIWLRPAGSGVVKLFDNGL